MRFQYLLYPEGLEKIQRTGLTERLDAFMSGEEALSVYGVTNEEDARYATREMGEAGFFKALGSARESFTGPLQKLFSRPDDHSWETDRSNGIVQEHADMSDVLLLLGWYPSQVLTPEEFANPTSLGFCSLFEMTGTLGAYMIQKGRGSDTIHAGRRWTSTVDGITLENEITGNTHCDFELVQQDKTPYVTRDPLGTPVLYRPKFWVDTNGVRSGHSVEPTFLALLLQYATQHDIPSEMLKDGGRPLLDYAASLDRRVGNTAEHMFGQDISNPYIIFMNSDRPFTVLDTSLTPSENPHDSFIGGSSEIPYRVFVGPNRELLFMREEEGGGYTTSVALQPSDMDDTLKGLMFQAAKGLGRTQVGNLMQLLDYRLSDRFASDVERYSRM